MRETGYYWVMFNWPKYGRKETYWEVASYFAELQAWIMFGSKELIPEPLEREVFLAIDEREVKRVLT